jgi:hypothetical protein
MGTVAASTDLTTSYRSLTHGSFCPPFTLIWNRDSVADRSLEYVIQKMGEGGHIYRSSQKQEREDNSIYITVRDKVGGNILTCYEMWIPVAYLAV